MRLSLASGPLFPVLVLLALPAVRAHADVTPDEGCTRSPGASPSADAQRQYVENAVGVIDRTPGFRDTRFSGPTWEAFQLKDHHGIDAEAFFQISGRSDLARRQHRRAIVKKSLLVGGVGLLAGGGLFAIESVICCQAGPTDFGQSSHAQPNAMIGLAIAGAGLVTLIVDGAISGESVDASEATAVGADYDRALRDRLGLPADAAPMLHAAR